MNQDILYRFLKGTATSQEECQIEKWLQENPKEHQKELHAVRFIFEAAELYGDDVVSDMMPAHNTVPLWRKIFRYAVQTAAVVLLVVAAGYFTQRHTLRSISDQTNTLEVPRGQRMELTLADGSHIWLGPGASIEYPVIFPKNGRRVKLAGEAMFEVSHDPARPFTVETFATDISVLGTKFNVDADEARGRFSAVLLQGKISISNRLSPDQPDIVMEPDEVVSLSGEQLSVGRLEDPDVLCWTEGLVYLSGIAFDELMAKFEQVFDVRIVITRETPPDIGKVSGKIRVNDGIENALRILQYAADFTFEKNEETNVITVY